MGFVSRVFGLEKKSAPEISYGTLDEIWARLLGGQPTKSGIPVTWETSLYVTTMIACAKRIGEAITVPCKLYLKPPGAKIGTEATDHSLSDLIKNQPNDNQSAVEYRETIGIHASVTGNAYSLINRVRGEIAELIPLMPARMRVNIGLDGFIQSYNYGSQVFDPSEIWHLRGTSWDVNKGLDVVRLAREAIGLALATEQTHASLHANGARPSMAVGVDKSLNLDQLARLAAFIRRQYSGLDKTGGIIVSDNAAKFTPLDMKGVDSQHIELRNLQVEEICRAMGVMPIMVGFSDKAATYASAEQMFLAHLVHTVRPWHDRVAGSMDRWLLTKQERAAGYYFAFTESAFLSPAMKDKAEYNKIALGGGGNPGWRTPDEVRADDECGPLPGGDKLYIPVTSSPIGPDGYPIGAAKPEPTGDSNGS